MFPRFIPLSAVGSDKRPRSHGTIISLSDGQPFYAPPVGFSDPHQPPRDEERTPIREPLYVAPSEVRKQKGAPSQTGPPETQQAAPAASEGSNTRHLREGMSLDLSPGKKPRRERRATPLDREDSTPPSSPPMGVPVPLMGIPGPKRDKRKQRMPTTGTTPTQGGLSSPGMVRSPGMHEGAVLRGPPGARPLPPGAGGARRGVLSGVVAGISTSTESEEDSPRQWEDSRRRERQERRKKSRSSSREKLAERENLFPRHASLNDCCALNSTLVCHLSVNQLDSTGAMANGQMRSLTFPLCMPEASSGTPHVLSTFAPSNIVLPSTQEEGRGGEDQRPRHGTTSLRGICPLKQLERSLRFVRPIYAQYH
ncbi:unnamed protein product [Cyprideis torosa]|uniref:Uncharacterized protein n=1 Tax=Cyprideis torosa TaxID=163714 RepID=A0A7R8WMP0_9CRUS|nr:unnamed protein product [Cyprideis torosa]CAG0899530.1 unnamed protein product [Cyprideis torosa]